MTVYHLHESLSSSIGDPVEFNSLDPLGFDGVRYSARKRNSYLYRAMLNIITGIKEQLLSAPNGGSSMILSSMVPEMIVVEEFTEVLTPFTISGESLLLTPKTAVTELLSVIGNLYMVDTGKVLVGHEVASYGEVLVVDAGEYTRRLSSMVVQSPTATYLGGKILLTSSAIRRLVHNLSDVKYRMLAIIFRTPLDLENGYDIAVAADQLPAFYASDPYFQSTMYDKLIAEATGLVKTDEFETIQKGSGE